MKKYILPIIITFIITFIFMFAVARPMGKSEAMSIISNEGSVTMYEDAVYITIPSNPSTQVLEAAAVVSEMKEGVYISVMESVTYN